MQNDKQPLVAADLERLTKFCGLFSSDHLGERAAAASLADRFLRDRGYRWTDVIGAPMLPPAASSKPCPQKRTDPFAAWDGWREAAQYYLRNHRSLTKCERWFCENLLVLGFTKKVAQRAVLLQLVERVECHRGAKR